MKRKLGLSGYGRISFENPKNFIGLSWNPSSIFGYTQNQKSFGTISFEILERVGPVSYLLKLPASHKNLHPVFHISKLRPISDSGFRGLRRTKLPTIPDQEYEVERILDNRFKRDKEQFLVKWKYYPETDSTWEPIENLKNSKAIVNAFRREQDASSYDA